MGEPGIHIAQRMAGIAPFHVMELLARAQALESQGRSIVHMEVGEPDFPTAGPVLDAARQALDRGLTRYTPAAGIPPLREAIAGHYRRQGVVVPAERIVVTPGASGALMLATLVQLDPGDRLLLADPGYPCNRHFVRAAGGEPVSIPVGPATGYQLDAPTVERHWDRRTVAALLASPSNPTGTLVGREALEGILAVAGRHGGRIIVDEIYHGLVYDEQPVSAVGVSDEAFVVNSFSKYFGMTGWRLGWLVAPQPYVREIEKLAQNLFLAPSTLAQHAALAAFGDEATAMFEERRRAFGARRDFLLPALREIGFTVPVTPQGAFYLYAGCERFTDDSFAFCRWLLEEHGVAITPGIDFGAHEPASHVRFAYTTGLERLEEGVARLRRALG